MNILAIDTSTEFGSLALLEEGELVAERALTAQDGYSSLLFTELQKLIEGGLRLAKIDVFAAGSGPGSFTGVRVALGAAKGLAEANGKGAIGISHLQALASFGTEPLRAVMIDARRNESYAAVYNDSLELVTAEIVGNPAAWLASLPDVDYQFIAQDGAWLDGILANSRWARSPRLEAPQRIAAAIGRCAAAAMAQGKSTDPVLVDANYVRRSDVNLFWHDR